MRRWRKRLLIVLVVGGVTLNVMAYFHGRAMTHWSDSGDRTPRPEELTWPQRIKVLFTGISVPRPVDRETPASVGLEFESLSIPNGRGDTLAAWLIESPGARVLFLVFHGYGTSKGSMLPVAAALHQLGHAALLVDFQGYGESSGRDTQLGIGEASDVAAALRFARERWPRHSLILYGESMGGSAVARAIARHDARADGVVLESTFASLLSATRARFGAMGVPATPLAELLLFWGGVASGIDAFDHRPVEYAPSIQCPSLLLHGEADVRVTSREAAQIFERLSGWKRMVKFESGAHGKLVLSDEVKWRSAIVELTERVSPRARTE